MSWLSDWIDKKSGKQDAIDIEAQQGRYDKAMAGTNAGYQKMMGIAEQQMDVNSELNRSRLAMMESSSADNAAESARLAQRTAASAGGAPAAAMAFQQQDMANKAQSGVMGQYQKGMFQQQEGALATMGGALANQGQIAQAGFNMGESAREYNKKVDARAMAQKGAMLGGALKIGGGLLMQNPAMALGGASSFLQEGGAVGYNTGGEVEDPENPKPVGNGPTDDSSFLFHMYKYNQAMKGEKFMGGVKGQLGAGLLGMATGVSPALLGVAGHLYGRHRSGKIFKESNEDLINQVDRDRYKQMRNEFQSQANAERKQGYQTGGQYSPLPGDVVDAKLEPGEYVLNRNAVNAIGKENLDEINNEKAPRFDKGKVKMRMGGYLYGG